MRVGLMTPGFVAHDAVGNDVLGMYNALRDRGDEPLIFTQTGESPSPIPVFHYADAPLMLTGASDLLIYHYCIADPVGLTTLRRLRCRLAVKYHNVTPAQMLAPYSTAFARPCRLGRKLLQLLPDMAIDAYIGASRYNLEELLELGVPEHASYVVPPMHRVEDLLGEPDDSATVAALGQHTFNVVGVGRIVPNKGFDIMARSCAAAAHIGKVEFHLHLVGSHDERLQSYIDLIGRIMADSGIFHRFTFHGAVSNAVLATIYRECDLFWTASRHEGFCVPAVEAMAFGLPILSSRCGALPETCGDAATYVVSEDRIGHTITELLLNDSRRHALGRQGRRRFEAEYTIEKLRSSFLDVVDRIVVRSERKLTASDLPIDGDWFGLPDADTMVRVALAVSPPLPQSALNGRDRRADFVDWILREGWQRSDSLHNYVFGQALRDYAIRIRVPLPARHLGPDMRLVWQFHRFANSRFDLKGNQDIAEFLAWFAQFGTALYPNVAGARTRQQSRATA